MNKSIFTRSTGAAIFSTIALGVAFIMPLSAYAQSNPDCTSSITPTTGNTLADPAGSNAKLQIDYVEYPTDPLPGTTNDVVFGKGAIITSICGPTILAVQKLQGDSYVSWTINTDKWTSFLGRHNGTDGTSTLDLFSVGDYISFDGTINYSGSSAATTFTVAGTAVKDWSLQGVVGKFTVTGTVTSVNAANGSFIMYNLTYPVGRRPLDTSVKTLTVATDNSTTIDEGNASGGFNASSFANISVGETITAIGVANNLTSIIQANTVHIYAATKNKFMGTVTSVQGSTFPTTLTMKTVGGVTYTINLTDGTQFIDKNGAFITFGQIQVGDAVAIGAHVELANPSILDAYLLVDSSIVAAKVVNLGNGQVTDVSTAGTSFTFSPITKGTYPASIQITMDSNTVVKEGNLTTGFSLVPATNVAVGELLNNVTGYYTKNSNTLAATLVKIHRNTTGQFDVVFVSAADSSSPTTLVVRDSLGLKHTVNVASNTLIMGRTFTLVTLSQLQKGDTLSINGVAEMTNPSIIDANRIIDSNFK